jgi:hypothetical protein
MGNPNPNMSGLTPFKPGQSGNPSGKSAEQRRLEIENGRKATIIRQRLLEAIDAKFGNDPVPDTVLGHLDANTLRLIKDTEDRALGAPAPAKPEETERNEVAAAMVALADKLPG